MSNEEEAGEAKSTLLLSLPEAARQLRITKPTLYKLFKTGRLRKRRLLGRSLVARSDLEAFVASLGEAS